VLRDRAKYGVERSDSKRLVGWYGNPVMSRIRGFQNNMTSYLMYSAVLPAPAKDTGELFTRDIAWEFHTTDRISSQTR
jgi:hypothetical protein